MTKIRVGVLRGGPSGEYEVSLETGKSVLKNLPADKYEIFDVLISKQGVWHFKGIEKKPFEILNYVDVIFNALHGEYGEDGKVQQFLDHFKFKYTGSGSIASALGMNKVLSKRIFIKHGIKTPKYTILKKEEVNYAKILETFKNFPQPSVVKPIALGSSLGVYIAKSFENFEKAIVESLESTDSVLIEEYIKGKEATCGVVEKFRGRETYPLLPIEIRPHTEFFDYNAKYKGNSEEICPGNFSRSEMEEIENLAVHVHRILGLRHYSRTDFIVHPKRGIYVLETNTLPGLTTESLLPKALLAVGSSLPEFLDHIVTLALDDK